MVSVLPTVYLIRPVDLVVAVQGPPDAVAVPSGEVGMFWISSSDGTLNRRVTATVVMMLSSCDTCVS